MNAVIIEDEAVSARRLRKMLEAFGVEVVALLHSVQESVEWFEANISPDLIFLDVQLGDGISFEIFEKVQPKSAIIFTTAYDKYALRAFKLNSVDYLLKPIKENELKEAIDKYKTQKVNQGFDFQTLSNYFKTEQNHYKERFLVQIGQELRSFMIDEVSFFYSEDKITYLVSGKRRYPVDFSLNDLEKSLNPNDFFRISRQVIVQHCFIESIYSYSGNRLKIKMKDNQEDWLVSRERVSDFKEWLT